MIRGTDPTPGRISFCPMVRRLDPTPGRIPLRPMVRGTDPTLRMSPTSVDVGGGAKQERCIPIPQRTEIRPEAVGIQRMDIPMVVGV